MTTVTAQRSVTTPLPAVADLADPASRSHSPLLRWLPLTVILVAQAALSARLVPQSVASGDESLYIYGGHQLIHELWHGGGSPYYETFFSGAPIFYPVIAAMADALGGLTAVRLMSLAFMLVANCLLFGTTRRIFGFWPAVAAAGLFAGLGLTQSLGALATYDAMALMLISGAAYCAVRAAESGPTCTLWLLLVPLTLLMANAAKYASALFDPLVIALGALCITHEGWKRAGQRFIALCVATITLLTLVMCIAGKAYLNGIMITTLSRQQGTQGPLVGMSTATSAQIVTSWWDWVGAIISLGAVALLASLLISRERRNSAVLGVLVLASILVISEYIHLQSNVSLSKHADYAAWFTCIAAGYGLARAVEVIKAWQVKLPLAAAAAAATIFIGIHYTGINLAQQNAKQDLELYAMLKPYLHLPTGRYLISGQNNTRIPYADHIPVAWYDNEDDNYINYPIPGRGGDPHGQTRGLTCLQLRPHCMYLGGMAGYQAAVRAHWFALISMASDYGTLQDAAIEQTAERTPGYVLLTTVGGAPTWIYAPAYQSLPAHSSS